MAEEQHASMSGPNGERLELKIGGKSLGLRADSLLPILLLLAGLVGGYVIWLQIDRRLEGLHDNHVRMFELLLNGQERRKSEAQQILRWLQTHDYNAGREPADHLPLDIDPALIPPQKPPP